MTTPATCPFHDLDPATTVWVDLDGAVLPYSAEVACALFHESLVVQSLIDAGLAEIYKQIPEDQP